MLPESSRYLPFASFSITMQSIRTPPEEASIPTRKNTFISFKSLLPTCSELRTRHHLRICNGVAYVMCSRGLYLLLVFLFTITSSPVL
jgi:hypothetical protein